MKIDDEFVTDRWCGAGWAGYRYCASHSPFFWGLRLYLVCTPSGMPILWALANPKLG